LFLGASFECPNLKGAEISGEEDPGSGGTVEQFVYETHKRFFSAGANMDTRHHFFSAASRRRDGFVIGFDPWSTDSIP
jgi:hypothetical protein